MTLNGTASTVLVIGFIVLSLVTAVALAGLAFGLTKISSLLEQLTTQAEPVLGKTEEILTVVSDKVASIGDRAEGILAQGEEAAESVHDKVDKTATAVQRTVHAPIIGLNSLAAGLSEGIKAFGTLQRQNESIEKTAVNDAVISNGAANRNPAVAAVGKES